MQKGPDKEQLQKQLTYIWGEVRNARGEIKTIRFVTANGYALTVTGSLAIVEHLLETKINSGYKTPSQIMGADFITKLPGYSERINDEAA